MGNNLSNPVEKKQQQRNPQQTVQVTHSLWDVVSKETISSVPQVLCVSYRSPFQESRPCENLAHFGGCSFNVNGSTGSPFQLVICRLLPGFPKKKEEKEEGGEKGEEDDEEDDEEEGREEGREDDDVMLSILARICEIIVASLSGFCTCERLGRASHVVTWNGDKYLITGR